MKLSLLKPLFIGIILLCLWLLIGVFGDFPHYIFPSPQAVWLQLTSHSELLWQHTLITLIEIGLGLLLGFLFGLSSALLLSFSPKTSSLLLLILVISQAIPVFAIAPILVLWLGYGMPSKIVMAILIIYFPVTAACYDGLRNTPQAWIDLAKTLNPPAYERWRGSLNSQALQMNPPILRLQRQLGRQKRQYETPMQMRVKRLVNVL